MDPRLDLLHLLAFRARIVRYQDALELVGRFMLGRLISRGTLESRVVLARPMLELDEPLTASTYDPHVISYAAQSRWKESPRPTRICHLSVREARRWCVSPVRFQCLKMTHDLHTARVAMTHPEKDSLLGEDAVRRLFARGQKIPDLVLMGSEGEIRRYVEFGGCYSAARVTRLLDAARKARVPIEIY